MNLNSIPEGDDWIARKLRDLEREITELRSARSLEASSIGGIPIGQLAYGQVGQVTDALFRSHAQDDQIAPPAFEADPAEPRLPVTVTGGRLLVMVSAFRQGSGGYSFKSKMSWRLIGPTAVGFDYYRALSFNYSATAADGPQQNTFCYLHTGLRSGDYQIEAGYSTFRTTNITNLETFYSYRSVIALPF